MARVTAFVGLQLPEQQSALGEQHPHTRTQDRIQANQCVVG